MLESEYVCLFSQCPGFGYKKLVVLKNYYGSFEYAWNSDCCEWGRLGLAEKIYISFLSYRKKVDIKKFFKDLSDNRVEFVDYWSDGYPKILKEIHTPPVVLFCQGNQKLFDKKAVAVVGTRKITAYGKSVLLRLIDGLVKENLVIISGLAHGIDSRAHLECLKADGETIAVLGGGIDVVGVSGARGIFAKIIAGNGLIVSEYANGVIPQKWHFPARNRIVSGLSLGVLVVEAPSRSGSLITANFALDQNRSVMAVPGDINREMSTGCNQLIKNGALLVCNVDDILLELGVKSESLATMKINYKPENEIEEALINQLKSADMYVDELLDKMGCETNSVLSTLNILAIKGVVAEVGGGKWIVMK